MSDVRDKAAFSLVLLERVPQLLSGSIEILSDTRGADSG